MNNEQRKYQPFSTRGGMPAILAGIAALLFAYLLKRFYSHASCADLSWVTTPLAGVVSFCSGIRFHFNADLGYVSQDGMVVIAKSCSGINFMIIVFLMTVFVLLSRQRTRFPVVLLAFLWAGGMAWGATLFANSIRILLSIQMYSNQLAWGWLTMERLHCLCGIMVYSIALLVCYSVADLPVILLASSAGSTKYRRFRILIPVGCYLLIAVIVPLLNGAYASNPFHFLEYCLWTLLIPAMVFLCAWLFSPSSFSQSFRRP